MHFPKLRRGYGGDCRFKVVGLVKSKKSPNWVSEKTDKLREERNKAKWEYNNKHTKDTKERCRALNSELNKAYEQDEIKHLEGKLEELKRASETNQHEVVWRVVEELSGKRTRMVQGSQTPRNYCLNGHL